MSLLTIVSDARSRLNLGTVSSVISNSDLGVIQMLGLLQDIGDEVVGRNFWQRLNIPGTITGDGVTSFWPIPVDFYGLSPGLQFMSSKYPTMPLVGPITSEEMVQLKALVTSAAPSAWRIINNNFEFFPILSAGEVLSYNYYSSQWILTVTGTRSLRWTSDTDGSLIDEKVLTRGLEWRWKAAKGFDYAEEFRRYEQTLDRADGRQNTSRMISMAQQRGFSDNIWPGILPIF